MNDATDNTTAKNIQIHFLGDMPHGLRWTWFGTELLVVEANLSEAAREAAIDAAFADLRNRSIIG